MSPTRTALAKFEPVERTLEDELADLANSNAFECFFAPSASMFVRTNLDLLKSRRFATLLCLVAAPPNCQQRRHWPLGTLV